MGRPRGGTNTHHTKEEKLALVYMGLLLLVSVVLVFL